MKEYILPALLAGAGAMIFIHKSPAEDAKIVAVPTARYKEMESRSSRSSSRDALSEFATPDKKIPVAVVKYQKSVSPQAAFDKPYVFFQEKLVHLKDCLQRQNCEYSQKSPKAYEAQIYSDIVQTLKTFSSWQKRHQFKDERIPELMRDFIGFDQAYIKIEALRILQTQNPDRDNIPVILEHVIQDNQPEPIALGMKELQRYRSSGERQKMDRVFEDVLLHGSVYAAVEVAKNVGPFVERNNYSHYRNILSKLERIPLTEEISAELDKSLD